MSRLKTPQSVELRVIDLYNANHQVADICYVCDVSKAVVHRIIREQRALDEQRATPVITREKRKADTNPIKHKEV
jgi:hypothetical protein